MRDKELLSNGEPFENKDKSHDRILKILAALVLSGTILTGIAVSYEFGAGFFLGGVFSFVNYYWMRITLRKGLKRAADGGSAGYMGSMFVLRYLLFGLIVAGIYVSGILPVIAVLIGVAGFALAVMLEGIINIFRPVKV